MSEPLRGRVLWYELLTKDTKAAEAFYTAVLGWTVQTFEESPQPYRLWVRDGGTPVGGVMTLPEGVPAPPHWIMYVGVPKLEDAVAQIETLGGSAVSPLIEATVGRIRVMKDPQQAMFAVFEPSSPPQHPETPPQPGEVSWHELMTSDAGAAMEFYGEVFGWKSTETMDMGPMGKYHMFGRSWPLGGMMNTPAEMSQVPPNWGFYFMVPDLERAMATVKSNGGKVLNGPTEVPGGDVIANCMDPQGAAFSMHQKKG